MACTDPCLPTIPASSTFSGTAPVAKTCDPQCLWMLETGDSLLAENTDVMLLEGCD